MIAGATDSVRDAVARCWSRAEDFFPRVRGRPVPSVRFNPRASRWLGRAWPVGSSRGAETGLIEFATGSLTTPDAVADCIAEIVPHEVAHLVDWMLHRRLGHGPTWVALCAKLGGNPSRFVKADQPAAAALRLAKPRRVVRFCYTATCGSRLYFEGRQHRTLQRRNPDDPIAAKADHQPYVIYPRNFAGRVMRDRAAPCVE